MCTKLLIIYCVEAVSTTVAAVDEHSPRLTDQEELSHDKTIAVTEKKLQDVRFCFCFS